MNWLEVMKQRYSVRQYTDRPIEENIRQQLQDEVHKLNEQSRLHMQLFFDEPKCFSSAMAQSLGLNSCWTGLNHGKSQAVIGKGEKQVIAAALGYGAATGTAHTRKPMEQLCSVSGTMPD